MEKKIAKTLFCIDVGNTSSSYAIFDRGKLWKTGYVSSNHIPHLIIKLLTKSDSVPYMDIVLSSVVPEITKKIEIIVRKRWHMKLWVVGENLRVPIKHNYRHINKLGSDRLVTAYGAMKIYGPPLLIFDFGTALTCDYISSKGVFMGGLIIPGPEISLRALSEKTALLPHIRFPKSYTPFIGRDTEGCMKAGVLQGYGAMTDGLIERFRRRYGKKVRVIATGGLVKVLAPYMSQFDIIDPTLTLKSIARLFTAQIEIHS